MQLPSRPWTERYIPSVRKACVICASYSQFSWPEQKQLGGWGYFAHYTSRSRLSLREVRAGTQGRETERNIPCQLSHWFMPTLLLYTAQAYQPRDGATHNGQGPLTFIINQGSVSQSWPRANLIEAVLKLRLLVSRPLEVASSSSQRELTRTATTEMPCCPLTSATI